jgi:diguanylate cyclase (GGDEF)-like protein
MSATRMPLLQALRAAYVRLGVAAVLAAGLILTLVSFLTLRTYVEQNLTLVAHSIAYSAEAATVFNDPVSANEIVTLIAAQEGLLSAEVVRHGSDASIASYVRERGAPVGASFSRIGTMLFPLQATARIAHEDSEVGRVTVRGDGGVYLMFLLKILAAVAGCVAIIGWWVARLSRRIENEIVNPLNGLAALTRKARAERALGLRASPAVVQEIHSLGEDFNALLAEIQSREAELVAKHDDLKTVNESLSLLAFQDSLTGMPNRASFMQHASRAILACRVQAAKVAILYVDSDNFKSVNDRLGHAAGDEVLIETAKRIRAVVRDTDFVARLGGDEFAVLLASVRGADEATRVAQEIAATLRVPVTSPNFGTIESSASIGVAVFPGHGSTVEALLLAADAAMYSSKSKQPGGYWMFEPAHDDQSNRIIARA